MASNITYTVRLSKRARGIRVSVGIDGVVVVSAPVFAHKNHIEHFVARHAQWIEEHLARAKLRTIVHANKKDIPVLKKKAQQLAEHRCAHFAKVYGLSFQKITIRAQKARWGSCSKSGNLSFNYKIVLLPPYIADYIIVHEICHLAEMNHSKRFWNLVAKEIPGHVKIRKALRQTHVVVR